MKEIEELKILLGQYQDLEQTFYHTALAQLKGNGVTFSFPLKSINPWSIKLPPASQNGQAEWIQFNAPGPSLLELIDTFVVEDYAGTRNPLPLVLLFRDETYQFTFSLPSAKHAPLKFTHKISDLTVYKNGTYDQNLSLASFPQAFLEQSLKEQEFWLTIQLIGDGSKQRLAAETRDLADSRDYVRRILNPSNFIHRSRENNKNKNKTFSQEHLDFWTNKDLAKADFTDFGLKNVMHLEEIMKRLFSPRYSKEELLEVSAALVLRERKFRRLLLALQLQEVIRR